MQARKAHANRIAFLLPDMGGGGAERVALSLIRNFVDRGADVDLILMRAEGVLLPLVPAAVRIIDLRSRRIRSVVWTLSRYLAETRPAAMQVSMWPLTVAGILARAISGAGTRIVVSDHAALSRHYADRGFWHEQFLKWSVRLVYPLADARVVVAREAAEDLARLSGLAVSDFEVVYNPVDPPAPGIGDAHAASLWGGAGKRILTVGRLAPQKNHKLLLEAFARLPADDDWRLMILGEGDLRRELEELAQELGIADRVLMPGFILDPGPIYRSANLFVLSSDYEGYPLVMIEAMHCGLTIVSTDCLSGPAEILAKGEFGTLTACGDPGGLAAAIARALDSPADPDRIKSRAAHLSADAADRYWELMTGSQESTAQAERSTTER